MDNSSHSSGIGLSPGVLSGTVTKGQPILFTLTIDNMNDVPVNVTASGGSFAQDQNTLMNYLVDAYSFDDWISFEETTLPAKSQTDISVTVTIPAETSLQKGSYYPALVLNFAVPSETQNTTIQLEHAVPIYLNVANTVLSKVELDSFKVDRFLFGSDVELRTELTNTGNTHVRPEGYVELYELSILGAESAKRIGTLPLNKKSTTLLPDSTYSETIAWEQNKPGHYQSALYITSGEEDTLVRTVDFWVVPTEFVLIATALAALTVTAIILWFVRRRSKGEKSRKKPPKRLGFFSFKLKKK